MGSRVTKYHRDDASLSGDPTLENGMPPQLEVSTTVLCMYLAVSPSLLGVPWPLCQFTVFARHVYMALCMRLNRCAQIDLSSPSLRY